MDVRQTFAVARPPEAVFDFVTDARNLRRWQTSKIHVEQLTDGPPRLGTRVFERTEPRRGRAFEQTVEFTEFERPHHVLVHVVDGPYPIDGRWRFEPDGHGGTRVHFETIGRLRGRLRPLDPLAKRALKREFARYHELLRRAVESR